MSHSLDLPLLGRQAWLQGDVLALAMASGVCRSWRATARYVVQRIFRADLSALGPRAGLPALQATHERVGSAIGGVRVLCLKGCTSLKPSAVTPAPPLGPAQSPCPPSLPNRQRYSCTSLASVLRLFRCL